eukprot:g192.t1.2.5e174188 g192  g192.t1 contig1:469903-471033(-)
MNCISPRLFVSPRNLLRHFHRANRPSCQLLSSTPASQTCDEGGHPQPDFRPKRIILIRHGESQGNVDQNAYVTTADWRIPITNLGKKQAQEAGKQLREKISEKDAKVVFYFSPYLRTKQTLDEILPYFDDNEILSVLEEPRISEQQIGNFQNVQQVLDAKAERSKFGRFFYRFPSGEAGLDVYSRVSSFIPTLVRDCDQYVREGHDLDNLNLVIVTHGLGNCNELVCFASLVYRSYIILTLLVLSFSIAIIPNAVVSNSVSTTLKSRRILRTVS